MAKPILRISLLSDKSEFAFFVHSFGCALFVLWRKEMLDVYRISFIGHREIYGQISLHKKLEEIVRECLCAHEFIEFYVGRNGDFDILAASVIKKVQRSFGDHDSALNLVLPYPIKDLEYYENYYDEVHIPIDSDIHPKAAITKRNQWMIDNSDLLIAYVEPDHKGGAYTTVKYAEKKGIKIINLAIER